MLVLTMFAELGSDGDYVARAAAQRLGLARIDQNVLAHAVNEGLSQTRALPDYDLARGRWVRQVAQRAVALSRTAESLPALGDPPPAVQSGALSDEAYLRFLQTILLELSRQGKVLIVGRGAEALLRDHPTSVHVRLVAPLERRIQRVMGLLQVDRPAAMEAIEHADSIHMGYMKYALNVDWNDPSLYDLTISTTRFPEERAVDLIVGAVAILGYRRRVRRTGPATAPEEAVTEPVKSPEVGLPQSRTKGHE
jgi:cytidylate kinase